MILASPVHGVIHPASWKRPAGNLDLVLTQPFGCRPAPSVERPLGACAHFHRAIDFGNGQYGADLLAVAAGVVTQAGLNPDGALVVVVNAGNGWFYGHAHLQDKVVSVGAHVSVGQKLGDLGMSGHAYGPHDHFAVKSGLTEAAYFWGDLHGKWTDPWPLLAQNVTVHPKGPGVNIRTTAGSGSTPGPLYATTAADGTIRLPNGTSLGPTATPRSWGGTVAGASYSVGGVSGSTWERVSLGGAYRFVASPLAVRSA